jgi:hypothetical protein
MATSINHTELREMLPYFCGADKDWLCGNRRPGDVAREWLTNGFDSVTAPAWHSAGAFDATAAAQLRDAGLTVTDVAKRRVALHGDYPDTTIAYAACNGDITIDRALELARKEANR